MAFNAPINYDENFKETVERVLKLIELKYIDNIEKGILKRWLKNFTTPEEKYFATLILTKLIYRSEKAILSMFQNIIELVLPELLTKLNIYEVPSLKEWKKGLITPITIQTLPFCISTVTGVDNNIGKSGEDLNRLLKEKQIIYKSINLNLIHSKPIPKKLNTIILIDDIAGTGKQFEKFYNKYKDRLEHFQHIIYVPLVAYYESIDFIEDLDDRIHMHPLETLDSEKVFLSDSTEKFDGQNTYQDLNTFYHDLLANKGISFSAKQQHYSKNTLYIFKISSPNTNLPLIYHEDDSWNKLFTRF